jgi:formate dehydrogenase subunit gamma
MEGASMTTIARPITGVNTGAKEYIHRFDIHQRLQHLLLMVSFIILVLTGMPMKFSDIALSKWWISVLGGVEPTRLIHRGAAWIMIAACVYHVLYLIYSVGFKKKSISSMVPTKQDFVLFAQEIGYFVGLRKDKPRYDRYNWREKFDYYAMFWGIPVMVLSGLVMMFPVEVSKFLPGWVIPAALIAHSDESMLALTWIVIVHVFFNHFAPGNFPMNPSIFTGKLAKERYMSEHPAEYERMVATGTDKKEG